MVNIIPDRNWNFKDPAKAAVRVQALNEYIAAAQALDLDGQVAKTYLSGGTLPADMRGWTLFTYRRMPLGWAKGADGVMKNHLPKGLRI